MPIVNGKKNVVGGSAAERGLDFQASVSAIVMAHLLAERPLGWLDGIVDDSPVKLDAETGGPGDDISIVTEAGLLVEVQVKRGLHRGSDLWEALLSLADGACSGRITAGVLAVCPNSSGTIRMTLAEDIVRLGTGRVDGLREIGEDFRARLASKSLDVASACSKLRIVSVSAVEGNRDAEGTACERLSRLSVNPSSAWHSLYRHARKLIRIRGRATADSLSRVLSLDGVQVKLHSTETRLQLQAAIAQWLHNTYAQMTILGVTQPVQFADSWIPLRANVVRNGPPEEQEIEVALEQYHNYGYRTNRSENSVDAHTIGRFFKKCVVLGGPGIGKSTLLRKLALEYCKDGRLVLLVKLPQVVAMMTNGGRRIEDCLWEVGLSGSGIRGYSRSLDDAVVLCDGLDECGSQQSLLTTAMHALAVAHPSSRIIVTSRPIGYQPGQLGEWRHYDLLLLDDADAESAVAKVLQAIPFVDKSKRDFASDIAKEQIKSRNSQGIAARSPLMLTLIAALASYGIEPEGSRAALYRQLFRLIEAHPPARLTSAPPSEPERNNFLDVLGWSLLAYENEQADKTLERCVQWWSTETGTSPLTSATRVQACLEYWECLGIVERVRTLTQEAITFVHKTFGEYAAARFLSHSPTAEQRRLIDQAIRTPAWREALSFASYFGLAATILDVWTELAQASDSTAAYSLDDAITLVVLSGVPMLPDALEAVVTCCWRLVTDATSRSRYVAGNALCIVSKSNWPAVRSEVLERLEAPDEWIRLLAWACVSVSAEKDISYERMIYQLNCLPELSPTESYLPRFRFGAATESAVRDNFVLGAVRRILQRPREFNGMEALDRLLVQTDSFCVGTFLQIAELYEEAGFPLPKECQARWQLGADLMPKPEAWRRALVEFLDTLDDPDAVDESGAVTDLFELGAFFCATKFWQMPPGIILDLSAEGDIRIERRVVLHAIARASGIDMNKLIGQARAHRTWISNAEANKVSTFFDLVHVDIEPDFDGQQIIGVESVPILERTILRSSQFFGYNAAQILYSLRRNAVYPPAVERLLYQGRGASLRFAATLAHALGEVVGQELILRRLTAKKLSPGCEDLYHGLTTPFGVRHEQAILKGLQSTHPRVAVAAAELASKLVLTAELIHQLLTYFDEWKAKEDPYPTGGGVVPYTPRDQLAKLLVSAYPTDQAMLMTMAKDERPEVRAAVADAVLKLAATSQEARDQLLREIASGELDPELLRRAIPLDTFSPTDVPNIVLLLGSTSSKIRYGAMPILDLRYLSADQVRAEAQQLLADTEIDIREDANKALRKLISMSV